jgi:hypothetical protein
MNKAQIKKAIMQATGNPEVGPIADNLDKIADAVLKINLVEESKSYAPAKETRVRNIEETR